MKKLISMELAVVLMASLGGVAMAGNFQDVGHGGISGPHYTLNIIGMDNPKNANMDSAGGNTIFVSLKGRTRIMLYDSGVEDCGGKDFLVLDKNGTDGKASFCLPEPVVTEGPTDLCAAPLEDEVNYSVYARALGTPGGSSWTTTCAIDDMDTPGDPSDDVLVCSSIVMKLERKTGQSKFTDVSKYLLFIYADIDGDGNVERVPLFDDALEGYFWRYDNNNLRHAQLRFYLTPTCVPPAWRVPIIKSITLDPPCVSPGESTTITINGTAVANWVDVEAGDITLFYGSGPVPSGNNGITIGTVAATSDSLLIPIDVDDDFQVETYGNNKLEEVAIYWPDGSGIWQSAYFYVNTSCLP